MKRFLTILASLIAVIFVIASCQASYIIRAESLPKEIAKFQHLKIFDHKEQPIDFLALCQKSKATILVFFQTKCACVKRYQTRVQRLYYRYAKDGFSFFYVSSNRNESFKDAFAEFKRRELKLPFLRDEGGHLAKAIGAKGTPTCAIINQNGMLEFLGWIDNEHQEHEAGRIAYLEAALRDINSGRDVVRPTSPMFGCPIR